MSKRSSRIQANSSILTILRLKDEMRETERIKDNEVARLLNALQLVYWQSACSQHEEQIRLSAITDIAKDALTKSEAFSHEIIERDGFGWMMESIGLDS